MAKRAVIFGASGMIGSAIARQLTYYDLTMPTSTEVPIEDARLVDKVLSEVRPHEVYICAAYTNVDKAEADPQAHKVNVLGVHNIVSSKFVKNTRIVFISTGYVFDGKKKSPYTTTDVPNPLNTYGLQKLAAESIVAGNCPNHLVVRTMSVFGKENARKNFAYQVIDNLSQGKIIYVPEDQFVAPIYAPHLVAAFTVSLNDFIGVAHVNGSRSMSKLEFAKTVARKWELDEGLVHPAPYKQQVARPQNGVLENSCAVPTFEFALEAFYANH